MSDQPINIFINTGVKPEFLETIRALSPQVEILHTEAVQRDPSLLAQVDVVYGRFGNDQWAKAPRLKWVQTTWAGMNGVLTPEAKAHPAVITNARIHGVPIAEHLFGMLLMFTRGLHIAHRRQQDAHWNNRDIPVESLPGKTLGILGLGAIGSRTAEIGHAFGMRVLGLRRQGGEVPCVERVYTPVEKHAMLAQCDYVMNTLPLTPETHHFLGEAELAVMKPAALLFNIGRGATIDHDALLHALQHGIIRGAGLDVTDPEPLPDGHPLWTLPNVIISPHYAGGYPESSDNAGNLFLDNLRRFLTGQDLISVVDKAAGY